MEELRLIYKVVTSLMLLGFYFVRICRKSGLSHLIQSTVIPNDPLNHDVRTNDSVFMREIYQHIAGCTT